MGRPLVDTVAGSKLANLKELRPGSSGRTEVRLLFIFDPQRRAVFLVGGDKAGKWSDWYRTAIPQAGQAYAEHLRAGEEVSKPPLNNPNARYWDDLVEDFGFTPEEQEAVRSGAERMIAEVRARSLANVRKDPSFRALVPKDEDPGGQQAMGT